MILANLLKGCDVMTEQRTYAAEVRSVFSGDDLMLLIDLGVDDLYKRKRVRLYGVDTPNAVGQGHDTEAGKLRNQVLNLLRRRSLRLTVHKVEMSSWVGTVEVEAPEGNINLNELLIAKGYKFNR